MSTEPFIHIKGAREHNLRDLEVRLPRGKFIVITGVSGSGKSSLAFDTLYSEGHRKYMESLSTQARAALEQLRRPDVDFIHGLSPVLAIEQRGAGSSPRSTIATVTEVADYARLLWTVLGEQRCPKDGGRVTRRTLEECVAGLLATPAWTKAQILAPALRAKPSVLREELPRLRQRGFQRVRLDGEVKSLDDPHLLPAGAGNREVALDLVIDRLVLEPGQRSRLADSLELAFREGRDRALVLLQVPGETAWREETLAQNLACPVCGDGFEPLRPAVFSFNHVEGACPDCGGLGRQLRFDESLLVPNPALSVRSGALKALRFGGKAVIIRHNALLRQLAEQLPFDAERPWRDLAPEVRHQILHGAGERLFTFRLKSRQKAAEPAPFAGIVPLLEEARRRTTSDGYRARLATFQVAGDCPTCHGARLSPRSAAVRVEGRGITEFLRDDIGAALEFVGRVEAAHAGRAGVDEVTAGMRQRLHFLREVGLGYLTLDREFASLSGGEAQRVRLASQLGMGLVGVIYVLDEPSIGLHPHDNGRLLGSLRELRDRGNTLVVVEHDDETMLAADLILELGPGAGREGGQLVFQGTPAECLAAPASRSRTGAFLSGRAEVERSAERRRPDGRWLAVRGATENNLRGLDASFPLGLLTAVTGVSGSGKSSLVNDVLARAAQRELNRARVLPGRHRGIEGLREFDKCVVVDQEPIGRSPRSNPATFTGILDELRALFARVPLARVRGYGPARFSFNARGGRCERCQGDGAIRLDMLFLADAYGECPSCGGRRYNRETLEIRYAGKNIAEVLAMTVAEAAQFFRNVPRLLERLAVLDAIGLGYLQLGQSALTLSGGEAQRLKLSLELARRQQGRTLYLLDEPTTGLHWADVQRLLDLLFRLRDAGNTVIVIEHHLDVIRLADWALDLGPGGGAAGGRLVFSGPPRGVARREDSLTGAALRAHAARHAAARTPAPAA